MANEYDSAYTGFELDTSITKTLAQPPAGETYHGGWANYSDLATKTTPFAVTGGAAAVKVPNDGLGVFTIERGLPDDITRLYNTTTQQFDLTDLKVDDLFTVRFDIVVTTSNNSQEVFVELIFAIGEAGEFTSVIAQGTKKLSGEIGFFRDVGFAAFNTVIIDAPAELRIRSDGDCDMVVNGYYMTTTRIG